MVAKAQAPDTELALDVVTQSPRVRAVRVQVLASRHGGVFFGPFVPDTRGGGRFPPAVRLRATLFGVPMGELTVANEHGRGRVLDLSIGSSWLARAIAAALVREAATLAPQAAWESLLWDLPRRDDSLVRLARSLGFRPVSAEAEELRFERPIASSAW